MPIQKYFGALQGPQRATHGRSAGESDRNIEDHKEWNSDDEHVDEFGRKKKRKVDPKKPPKNATPEDWQQMREAAKAAEAAPPTTTAPFSEEYWKRRREELLSATSPSPQPNPLDNQLSSASGSSTADRPVAMQAAFECMQQTMSSSTATASSSFAMLSQNSASMQQAVLGMLQSKHATAQASLGSRPQAAHDDWQAQASSVLNLKRPAIGSGPVDYAVKPAVGTHWVAPGRKSAQDAAIEVSERATSARCAASQTNRGSNTGVNQFVMRRQMVPLKPCTFFAQGHCHRGASCTFKHERREQCKFWVNGRCMKGQGCTAEHPEEDQEVTPVAAFVDFDTGDRTSGMSFAARTQTRS